MIVTRSDYATGLGKGVARRSRDGEEQAAEKGNEDAKALQFLHTQAPPCRLRLPSPHPGGGLR